MLFLEDFDLLENFYKFDIFNEIYGGFLETVRFF
jgi:hypothetical protein